MKFNLLLSEKLGHDVYVMTNGAIYLQFKGNQYHIGTTGSTIHELRDNMEKYVWSIVHINYLQYL